MQKNIPLQSQSYINQETSEHWEIMRGANCVLTVIASLWWIGPEWLYGKLFLLLCLLSAPFFQPHFLSPLSLSIRVLLSRSPSSSGIIGHLPTRAEGVKPESLVQKAISISDVSFSERDEVIEATGASLYSSRQGEGMIKELGREYILCAFAVLIEDTQTKVNDSVC